jgi:hypothetical protein
MITGYADDSAPARRSSPSSRAPAKSSA